CAAAAGSGAAQIAPRRLGAQELSNIRWDSSCRSACRRRRRLCLYGADRPSKTRGSGQVAEHDRRRAVERLAAVRAEPRARHDPPRAPRAARADVDEVVLPALGAERDRDAVALPGRLARVVDAVEVIDVLRARAAVADRLAIGARERVPPLRAAERERRAALDRRPGHAGAPVRIDVIDELAELARAGVIARIARRQPRHQLLDPQEARARVLAPLLE